MLELPENPESTDTGAQYKCIAPPTCDGGGAMDESLWSFRRQASPMAVALQRVMDR
jgi:hypothetical protein